MSEAGGPAVRPGEQSEQVSTGELVSQLTRQISELARDELRLAQAEMRQKGKQAGLGAGLATVGGVLALLGSGALVIAMIAALALVLPVWSAAVIVGVALLLIAGLLALTGFTQVKRGTPVVPEQAIESTKRDVETVKESVRR